MLIPSSAEAPKSFAFGPYVLIPDRQALLVNGAAVRLGSRAFDILTALVERPGEVVSKDELMIRAWPTGEVDAGNLKVNMGALRRVLGDDIAPPRYIATVFGRGYRFIAPVEVEGSRSNSTPAHDTNPKNSNLPILPTRIVGRAELIDGIVADLDRSRLISIVGMGGIGKTTMALAIGESAIPRFKDGVWFIDLAALEDETLVPDAIASAIGLSAHSGNMSATLSNLLREQEMLLILDNCEHLIDQVATCVLKLLESTKNVRLLTTTREPLRVKGERVQRLPGLAAPLVSLNATASDALNFPAVQLFVERALDRNPSFQLTDENAPLVAEICSRLDGVALSIELAATRLDALSLQDLLRQLDDRFRLLQGNRAGPERHRSLTSMIDWSYDLLTETQKSVIRRIAIFPGSFDLDAFSYLFGSDGFDAIEELTALVSKSLVVHDQRGARYRLLDTTRSYALQKLEEVDGLEKASLKFGHFAVDLADRAENEAELLSYDDWQSKYRPRIDDVRAALRWLFGKTGELALGIKLTVLAIPYWERLSLLDECRVAVERALDPKYGDFRSEQEDLLLNLALGASRLSTQGPQPDLIPIFDKALTLAEKLGDKTLERECLRGHAQYSLWAGDTRALFEYADRLRHVGGPEAISDHKPDGSSQTGLALHSIGNLAEARRQLEEVLAIPLPSLSRSERNRFEFDQGLEARGSLAMVLWLQGYPDQAVKVASRQLLDARKSNHVVPYCAAILLTSVCISLYVGNFDETETLIDFAERYSCEHDLALWSAIAHCMRVKLHLEMSRAIDLDRHAKALSEIRNGGLGMRYPPFLANHAHALARSGENREALAVIGEAIRLAQESRQLWGIPELLRMKGTFIGAGDEDRSNETAAKCFLDAIELAKVHGSLTWELRAAMDLAELRSAPTNSGALQKLQSAYASFREGFGTRDLKRARKLVEHLVPLQT